KEMLLEMIAEVTGEAVSEAKDEARLSEDLHLDSLARVQLQSLLESRLGVEASDDAIAQMQTLGELRAMIGGAAEIAEPLGERAEGTPTVAVSEPAQRATQPVAKEQPLPYYRW